MRAFKHAIEDEACGLPKFEDFLLVNEICFMFVTFALESMSEPGPSL